MEIAKLKNYVTYIELRYKRTDVDDARARNVQDIEGLLRNDLIDQELAEALTVINDSMARVARKRRI